MATVGLDQRTCSTSGWISTWTSDIHNFDLRPRHLGIQSTTQANSAWPSLCGMWSTSRSWGVNSHDTLAQYLRPRSVSRCLAEGYGNREQRCHLVPGGSERPFLAVFTNCDNGQVNFPWKGIETDNLLACLICAVVSNSDCRHCGLVHKLQICLVTGWVSEMHHLVHISVTFTVYIMVLKLAKQ